MTRRPSITMSLAGRARARSASPRSLRLSVHHAGSLAAFITCLEESRGGSSRHPASTLEPRREKARAWLSGRAQEIECFVTDIACDIHRGALDEVRAATAIDDYLLTLHEGLARHLGERFPACCRTSSAAVTEAPTSPEDRVTRRFLAKSG